MLGVDVPARAVVALACSGSHTFYPPPRRAQCPVKCPSHHLSTHCRSPVAIPIPIAIAITVSVSISVSVRFKSSFAYAYPYNNIGLLVSSSEGDALSNEHPHTVAFLPGRLETPFESCLAPHETRQRVSLVRTEGILDTILVTRCQCVDPTLCNCTQLACQRTPGVRPSSSMV